MIIHPVAFSVLLLESDGVNNLKGPARTEKSLETVANQNTISLR